MATVYPTEPRVCVLGSGSWGTALAMMLSSAGRDVCLWGHDAGELTKLRLQRENAAYLPGIAFHPSLSVAASIDLQPLAEAYDVFLVVVPSHAFTTVCEQLKVALQAASKPLSDVTLLWGTKGFDPSGALLSDIARAVFGEDIHLAVLSGPSFAGETARGMPTALTCAAETQSEADKITAWCRAPNTRIYSNDDWVGVQVGGAVKNVMAVAAGISDGLGFGANARAALITRGLAELTRIGLLLGGKAETFMGLAGMGDLLLTCTDNQSRNRRFGLAVGKGMSIEQAIKDIGQEVEGYNATRELYHRAQSLGLEMPITQQVYEVLYQGKDPAEAVQVLLNRAPKAESSRS